ncbi:MAG: protein-glutamate O-methyltransferase [Pseudomonadota bacterium]
MNVAIAQKSLSESSQERDFEMSERDFDCIAGIIREEAGIALSSGKSSLVYSRLSKRIRKLKLETFSEYCQLVSDPSNTEERRHLLTSLTTNVTNFFREPHHFDDLKANVLPALLEKAARGERVRLWSAACSSGQEPYTIAMCVLGLAPEAASWDLRILATDIDPTIVNKARTGEYEDQLLKNVPDVEKKRFFSKSKTDNDIWCAKPELKSLISFKEMNLIRDWPVRGPFDVIFCRNVVIYFEEETEQKVWSKFAKVLAPSGQMYIGHSERISGPATKYFEAAGVTTYKRVGGVNLD